MSSVLTTGLRERKKAATHEAIHAAARDLVEAHGLGSVTVEAIAERADVAPRTFFNHFASKEEAVLGWNPANAAGVAAEVRAGLALTRSPLDSLRGALTELVVTEAVTSTALQRRLALLRREPLLLTTSFAQWEQLTAALIAAVAEAVPDEDYANLVVHVAVAAVRSAMQRWSTAPSTDLGAAIDQAFAALRAGMPAPTHPPTDDLSPDPEP